MALHMFRRVQLLLFAGFLKGEAVLWLRLVFTFLVIELVLSLFHVWITTSMVHLHSNGDECPAVPAAL